MLPQVIRTVQDMGMDVSQDMLVEATRRVLASSELPATEAALSVVQPGAVDWTEVDQTPDARASAVLALMAPAAPRKHRKEVPPFRRHNIIDIMKKLGVRSERKVLLPGQFMTIVPPCVSGVGIIVTDAYQYQKRLLSWMSAWAPTCWGTFCWGTPPAYMGTTSMSRPP